MFWGCILSVAACLGALHSTFISASWMALNISVPIALFVFFLFVGLFHPLLGLLHRRLSLQRAELGVVFIMVMMAATVPTEGFVEHLLPKLVSVFYYTAPENEWAALIHPHLRPWLVPQDLQAVRYFFEGLPQGVSIPWGVWVRPLFYWSLFFMALCFVMTCMAVILRRQWMEHERLVYPLAKLPLEMLAGGASPGSFYRSITMWLGFFIPFTLLSLQALHRYYNFIPTIVLDTSLPLVPDLVDLRLSVSFMTLGFSYFVNLQVLLSIWVFYLLTVAQQGLFSLSGLTMGGQLTGYATAEAIPAHQGMGAMLAFVLFSLWVARGHLQAVGRKAFLGAADVDDSTELLSYRTAVLGTIAGLVFLGGWLHLSGLPGWLVPWFLFIVFVLYVGLSRFVAEAGLATLRAPIYPQSFISSSVGTAAIGAEGLVALGLTYGWILKVRLFALAACTNALKLDRELGIGGSRRRLFGALALAVVISLLFSYWFLLKQVYTYGGINMNRYFFALSETPYRDVAGWIVNPTTANWQGWFYVGVGSALMVLLMMARHFLLWWPLHPIGFPVATTWVAHQIWLSIFLVWCFKSVLLRYGGPSLYRRIQPFFLGLVLGNITAGGVWLLLDGFTGMQGNVLVYY